MAMASSSTSITVNWTEPSIPNGIIRLYTVMYYRFLDEDPTVKHINVTGTTAVLSGLDIYTLYTLWVEAFTVEPGVSTAMLVIRTGEDGKWTN